MGVVSPDFKVIAIFGKRGGDMIRGFWQREAPQAGTSNQATDIA